MLFIYFLLQFHLIFQYAHPEVSFIVLNNILHKNAVIIQQGPLQYKNIDQLLTISNYKSYNKCCFKTKIKYEGYYIMTNSSICIILYPFSITSKCSSICKKHRNWMKYIFICHYYSK